MTAIKYISGSYVSVLGDHLEVIAVLTGQHVAKDDVVSFLVSGGQVLAYYHIGRRGV